MKAQIVPAGPGDVAGVSRLLETAFGRFPSAPYCTPVPVLQWKYFDSRPGTRALRSLVAKEEDRILAHVGVFETEFLVAPGCSRAATAAHMVDWVSADAHSFLGAMLMRKALAGADAGYALGCTAVAREVMLAGGYEEICQVPLFHKVCQPWKPAVWREIHGPFRLWPGLALLAADFPRAAGRLRVAPISNTVARQVAAFGDEPARVLAGLDFPLLLTARSPAMLNHLLGHPSGCMKGWVLEAADGALAGIAVTAEMDRGGVRVARIVDLMLPTRDEGQWVAAVAAVEAVLASGRPDLVSVCGSTPWLAGALCARGFLRRGKTVFYLRDLKRRIDRSLPVHLTHFEADVAYI